MSSSMNLYEILFRDQMRRSIIVQGDRVYYNYSHEHGYIAIYAGKINDPEKNTLVAALPAEVVLAVINRDYVESENERVSQ